MRKLNDQFSLTYKDGYFIVIEHAISEKGRPYNKSPKTFANQSSCTAYLLPKGLRVPEIRTACEGLVADYPIKLARMAAKAKRAAEARKEKKND